ncbi:hypothetical protein KAH94_01200 [bacterium]|nr:hypothetical protein [bacterium]
MSFFERIFIILASQISNVFWPLVILIILFNFKTEIKNILKVIVSFINRLKSFRLEGFQAVLNSSISDKTKERIIEKIINPILVFCCKKTKFIKNITGDGSIFTVPFISISPDLISKNGLITIDKAGIYFINWSIFLSGIKDQTKAKVIIETSSETVGVDTNNLNSLKNDDGTLVLIGSQYQIQLDCGDTIKLKLQVGVKENKKTVCLAKSEAAYFCGNLVGG